VYHSHDYSARQQFERNFDIAVSQLMYKEYFEGLKSESEGIKLVKKMATTEAENTAKKSKKWYNDKVI